MKTNRKEESTVQKMEKKNMEQLRRTKQNTLSMKKIMIAIMLASAVMTSAFAGDDRVPPGALQAFNSKFQKAKSITWTANGADYKASFNLSGDWMYARYTKDGKFISVTRNISSTDLPFYLRNSLSTRYGSFWITDLVEESDKYGYCYYIKLENADKQIVLKSRSGNDWAVSQRIDK